MKAILISTLLLLLGYFSDAQNLNIVNQYNFGGSGDEFMSLTKSPNNDGYFALGSSTSNISGNKTENSRGQDDIWFVKLDNSFSVVWDKTIGGSIRDNASSIWYGLNEIYILGSSNSNVSGEKTTDSYGWSDFWLLCMDFNGNILWQQQYGGDLDDLSFQMIEFSDTSLLLMGDSQSGISGNKTSANIGSSDLWLIEVSKQSGEKIQERTLGSQGEELRGSMVMNSYNNHVYLTATAAQGASGDKTEVGYGAYDLWLVELDENLNVVRNKCFGGSNDDFAGGNILIDENFIYVLSSSRSSNDGNKSTAQFSVNFTLEDVWAVKLDYNFNIIWDKSFGGNKSDLAGSLFKNINGNLVLSTASESFGGTGNKTAQHFSIDDFDLWLLILDSNGNILAQESYGSTGSDFGYVIPGTNETQELIWSSYSNGINDGIKTEVSFGGYDHWVLEIDASDFLSTASLNSSNQSVAVYPNPFTSEANFKFRNLSEEVTISFYTVDGRLIDEVRVHPSLDTIYSWKNSGSESLIMYSIQGETVHFNGKLVR